MKRTFHPFARIRKIENRLPALRKREQRVLLFSVNRSEKTSLPTMTVCSLKLGGNRARLKDRLLTSSFWYFFS